MDQLGKAILMIDNTLKAIISNLYKLQGEYVDFQDFVEPTLLQNETELQELVLKIGSKPSHLND